MEKERDGWLTSKGERVNMSERKMVVFKPVYAVKLFRMQVISFLVTCDGEAYQHLD